MDKLIQEENLVTDEVRKISFELAKAKNDNNDALIKECKDALEECRVKLSKIKMQLVFESMYEEKEDRKKNVK